jgi:hypothetical protein
MSPSDPNQDQQPGRIPESLIDAALDGELCDRMSDEIAHALRYDKQRRAELLETTEAIRSMRDEDLGVPDFQLSVLNALDKHDKFIPRTLRKSVRLGRLAVAAGFLLGLMGVAALQSLYPRLTSISAPDTPVLNVTQSIEDDATHLARQVETKLESARANLSPLTTFIGAPRQTQSINLTLAAEAHPDSGDLSRLLTRYETRRVIVLGRADSDRGARAPWLVSFSGTDSVWIVSPPPAEPPAESEPDDEPLPELP